MRDDHDSNDEELKKALERIAILERENGRLKENLAELRKGDRVAMDMEERAKPEKLARTSDIPSSPHVESINNQSSPQEKVALFRSLFRGREDVFAIRWSGKNNRSGYSPACLNDWKLGICGKYKKTPCAKCEHRQLIPLDASQIYRHLKGEIVVGIYPLLDNDTCHFLAIDFDKKEWREDVLAIKQTCSTHSIPAYTERSRSGNGAHVWMFFEEAVSAGMARKLGSAIITATLDSRHQIGLDSYDRLFPNQDSMPKGGFGNLIALPLQKQSREQGNSVFLDDELSPMEDQWQWLANFKRIGPAKLTQYISELTARHKVAGMLAEADQEEIPPWQHRTPAFEEYEDLPAQANIVLSNMIYIEKAGLPQKLLSHIIRLAAFQNPEFYKAQALRMPIYNIPRIINLSGESDEYLALPRGCCDALSALMGKLGIITNVRDLRYTGEALTAEFIGKLSPEQLMAGQSLLARDNGILSATTAFGKTVVAIWMIAQRKTNTLIVVHRRQLMEQWLERLGCFLDGAEFGAVGAGKDKRSGKIDVAILQSLYQGRKVKEFVSDYGMVIVDECHHISAFSFEQVLKEARAKYVYGITATPVRKDGQHPIVYMQCGPIRYKVDARSQLASRSFTHKVKVRHTAFQLPESLQQPEARITAVYQALIEDEARNKLILDDIIASIVAGRSPLILTERTAHVEFFASKLVGFSKNIISLRGGMGRKQFKAVREQLQAIPDNEERVIISTGKYIGEGFDDSRLDTLFLTLPISWKGTLQQYAGRLHRAHANKTQVTIYDYVDREVPVLAAMFRKRIKGYEGMGYTVDQI
ncbi:MAG: DEAD/DEAH box helicase [Candidatus Cloacimonetes bacterium]|nr:DEAD/DEAH box helicase [Candidatus Cloacimonadota bacterium]